MILVAFFVAFQVEAQSLSDIQNIKVDNLSDAQIEQLIKRAEASGLTSNQLVGMARERGMPAAEAMKLSQRISQLQSAANSTGTGIGSFGGRSMTGEQGIDMFDSLRRSDPYYDLTPTQKKIFGYKLFHNRSLDFSPSLNLPTPLSYVIGSGDQLLVDVYGASQQSFDLTVTPEGRVLLPNIGPIQVGGSTIEAASARIKTSLGRIYSGLLGSNPNTFLQVRLGNIRSIKVSMVGELTKPGTYTLPSFATVFNALYAAGGPNENGAFRNVQVYRNSKLAATVDIYEFLSKGDQNANIVLQDNDVVIVPPLQARVEVIGPVRREGLFEVKPNETLSDLYIYTGGFQSLAYKDRVTVRRIENNERKVFDVPQSEYATFQPKDGDEILVGEALERFTNRVQVTGSVYRPGEFALSSGGLTVKQLVEKAEGLRPEAFTTRATLYRTSDDLTLAAVPLDLKGILDGTSADVELKNEDLLFVPSRYDIQEEYYVKVSGEVNFPGTYPFASEMTVGDLVLRAGGFLESASNSSIEIARRVRDSGSGKIADVISLSIDADMKLSQEEASTPLSPFDHIFIRRRPGFEQEQLITVKGEVRYPGNYAITSANERISDVIKRSGGLSQFAYPKGASLIRRTIYFEGPTEEEIREDRLKELRDNLDPLKNRNTNEAEQILFERIERKLEQIEEVKAQEERSRFQEKIFEVSNPLDSLSIDSTLNASRYKEEDLVGIDLEYIMDHPGSEADLILFEGDVIQIPKQLQTVRMVGEVLLPTTTRFEKNKSLKAYISKAGGFTENARRSKAYVIYANGDAAKTKSFLGIKNYPKLEPGAEIVVPKKPIRERMSAAGWIGIASSLATLGILVERLIN
ncbi:protein involved in polysaccharide export with SLBB domain [Algoriphagus zhangzhouensis]|uniref:Protein involved in polysaccharide export, contains SLBB domain of the beta-grasp fold n=1 Tax=Algoriphagus zhangzhouensis TaxID=1073327 RepID=A0A1M7ZHQ3_9BACT|nr:protein involved in polysaccharide export with SLBB domain [Algoriphagus zhangzhouensis]SHO64431.1 protein involved in polysaccharide export, contains SLBB domain of the beta-grasp fold [Algoriphagus zhangzhouensis]